MNATYSAASTESRLEIAVSEEVAPLARELRQACDRADLRQVLSSGDFNAILMDWTYSVGDVLSPCIAAWLGSSFADEIDAASVRLAPLFLGNAEKSVARARVSLAHGLDMETSGAKSALFNRLYPQFFNEFCNEKGIIDWPKLVEFNSGNMKG